MIARIVLQLSRFARAGGSDPNNSKQGKPMAVTKNRGFAFEREQFQQIIDDVLRIAKAAGATDAAAEVSEGSGLSVSVRKGEVENVERNRDKSVGVAIYIGQRRGNASTSDFSTKALEQTVRAAYDIARFTAEDPAAGLPEAEDLATPAEAAMDLDLFHPWEVDVAQATALAKRCEDAAFATDRRITNSEGAGVSAQQSHFWTGNSRGFRGGYASSRHSLSVAPIAGKGNGMQRDHWYSSMRDATELSAPEAVGRYAAERALSRLKSRKVATCEVPILFESSLAAGLLGAFVQGVSGGALYRKASFLQDCLGTAVFPQDVDIFEFPHEPRGKGSAPFDDEGVRTRARDVVSGGQVQGYFLSSYSARKLGMKTTGHAGGSQNLRMTHRRTQPGDDLPAMLRKLDRGLFVIELMGQGVNYVTGDYSRGAAGFWVEGGAISHPVHEITIAGNLKDMFRNLVAVGRDVDERSSIRVGSMLIDEMTIAGE